MQRLRKNILLRMLYLRIQHFQVPCDGSDVGQIVKKPIRLRVPLFLESALELNDVVMSCRSMSSKTSVLTKMPKFQHGYSCVVVWVCRPFESVAYACWNHVLPRVMRFIAGEYGHSVDVLVVW